MISSNLIVSEREAAARQLFLIYFSYRINRIQAFGKNYTQERST